MNDIANDHDILDFFATAHTVINEENLQGPDTSTPIETLADAMLADIREKSARNNGPSLDPSLV